MCSPSLLGLPLDIRRNILRCVLHEESITIRYNPTDLQQTMRSNAHGEILHTCTQLSAEGAMILYGENKFCASAHHIFHFDFIFLVSIGRANVSMIKHINFDIGSLSYVSMFRVLIPEMLDAHEELSNLKRLTWNLDLDFWMTYQEVLPACKWSALVSMRELPNLSKLVGSQNPGTNPVYSIVEESATVNEKEGVSLEQGALRSRQS